MKISQYVPFMQRSFKNRRRVLSKGKPGVGKTYGAMEAAALEDMDFIGICSALEDPSTIRGYPSRGANGEATHCLFDGIAKAFKAERPTVLFFDDLGMASEATARSIVRLFQFGEVDNRRLPDHVVLGAATNDISHGAGVYGMVEPLKTRFHTIIEVETDLDDVMAYGFAHDWPADMCAYLRNDPSQLHSWKPSKAITVDGACPRGWDYAAEWINLGETDPEVIAGCVGKGAATSYLAFRELANDLPDIDAVILDPDSAPVPDNPGARLLISMTLASRMQAGNFGQCVKYLNKLPQIFRAFSIRDAFRAEAQRKREGKLPKDFKALHTSRDYTAWAVSQDGKDVMAAAGSGS